MDSISQTQLAVFFVLCVSTLCMSALWWRQRQQYLQQKEVFDIISTQIKDIVWVMHRDLSYRFVSSSVTGFRGITQEQALQETIFDSVPEHQIEAIVGDLTSALVQAEANSHAREDYRTIEYELRNKDGSYNWVESVVSFEMDDDGKVDAIIGVTRNISERRAAEETRLQLIQSLAEAQKQESIGLLAGGIAHDFNNLMLAVLGHAELIGEKLKADDPLQSDLQKIVNSAESAAKMCAQMLAFSGKGQVTEKHINLSTQVKELLDLIGSSLPSRAIVEYELDHGVPDIISDSSQIDQIIMNLVINAGEALPASSGSIRIKTHVEIFDEEAVAQSAWSGKVSLGTFICLQVQDSGHGILPEHLDSIFEPFFTTKTDGRGMGLAAVAGVVRANSGLMKVDSSASGTTFSVALPAATVAAPAPGKAPAAPTSPPGQYRVLVVDDEEAIRSLAGKMLESRGHSVVCAESGSAALKQFNDDSQSFDLVLLDLAMPGMDGVETFHALRELNATLPITFASGYHQDGLPEEVSRDE